jgi:hypothetical protein
MIENPHHFIFQGHRDADPGANDFIRFGFSIFAGIQFDNPPFAGPGNLGNHLQGGAETGVIDLFESEVLSGRKPVYRMLDDAELMLTIYAAKPGGTDSALI